MDSNEANSIQWGRILFAIALIALGVEQLVFGDFIPGSAIPLPLDIPGRRIWGAISGLLFVIAGGATILSKKTDQATASTPLPGASSSPRSGFSIGTTARLALSLSGVVILIWPGLRHLPLLLSDLHSGIYWTWTGKVLAISGCIFIIASSLPASPVSPLISWINELLPAGRYFIGIFMILGGIQHFIYVPFVATLVPGWIPGHVFWTYFAAIALIAGGLGLFLKNWTKLAALLSCIMIGLWAIFLHIPRVMATPNDGNEWSSLFETFAFTGALFVLSKLWNRKDRNL